MRPAVLIYNPNSGSYKPELLPRLTAALESSGYQVDPRPTAGPGDATDLARQAADNHVAAVFAKGGDGTVRETAAGLLGSRVPLGILPSGTANVLARVLRLPRRSLQVAQNVSSFEVKAIDVGLLFGAGQTIPFLMMASAGLDAAVMSQQFPRLKKVFGRGAYFPAIFGQWLSYKYPAIPLRWGETTDREDTTDQGTQVVVANTRQYGGDTQIAPDADLADGLLDLVVFKGGRAATATFAVDLMRGRHLKRSDVMTQKVREVDITAPQEVRIQIDGDALDLPPPWRIEISQERLHVLVPPKRRAT